MRRSILTLFLGLLISIPLMAAQDEEKKFKDWASRCTEIPANGQVCFIFQNLLLKTNKQRLLYMRVGYFGDDKTPTALFTLPLGVSLPGGVSVKIDKRKKIRIRYERCDKFGCLAPLVLKDEVLKAMQVGLKAQVSFFDGRGREISIPVSLLGFTAGLESLHK